MNLKLFLSLLIFFLLHFYPPANAQSETWIQGKLVDARSNKPIPFATIKLKSWSMGVISNAAGDFQLPTRYKSLDDTLVISCIGYNTRIVILNSLSDDLLNIIRLTEAVNRLSEVQVLGKRMGRLTGHKIVAAAIQNIDKNFPQQPFCYEAYYRDYQFIDSAYTNLNEAIVKVLDSGFQTVDQRQTKIKLYEYKRNSDFVRDTATEIAYDNKDNKFVPNARLKSFGGNELTILRVHDPIRNNNGLSFSFIYNFRSDFLKNHIFSIGDPVYLDSVPLYCVNFVSTSTASGTKHAAKGKIYIEHNNFAIHKIEYATYEKPEDRLLFDIQVEYSRADDSMYLNYISFNNFFKLRNPADFKILDVGFARGANVVVIDVNKLPDSVSALQEKNYHFTVDGRRQEIQAVKILPQNPKQIVLYLKRNKYFNRWESTSTMLPRFEISCKGVTDTNGMELDNATYISINQFRELFVQKINLEGCYSPADIFMDKEKPIFMNFVPSNNEKETEYTNWMNTPLRKKN